MDHRLSNRNTVRALPSAVKAVSFRKFSASFVPNSVANPPRRSRILRRGSLIVSAGPRNCESSSLKTPLKPRSEPGKYLSRVLQNQRQEFHIAVVEELKQLAIDQDAAVRRMNLSAGSDEASLHRRIAELHHSDCRTTLQDVMYMLIVFNFSEIKVHLLPKLTDCTINGRLHIWPAKDWELESIHNKSDALDMVRQHVYAVTGLTPQDSNDCRETSTQIQKRQLSDIYSSSIQYGYFLQSVSTRHRLEKTLSLSHLDRAKILSKSSLRTWPYGWNQLVFGESSKVRTTERFEKLSGYVVGFDSESLQRCGRVRSREAMGLIEKQRLALFGDGDEVVWASFSSLKRLVLEAVGFGSFLWDVEEYVDKVYKLSRD